MSKKYTSSINRRSPRPRSKRLRERGIVSHVSSYAVAPSGDDFGLQDSLLSFRSGINTLLVPCDSTGTEITWEEASQLDSDGSVKAKSLKAKVDLWTVGSFAGKGATAPGGSGGGGGGSLFGLYTDTTWVSVPADDDALSAVLGKSLHARVSVLEGAGYLTAITKTMVEAVLTGDITSHTHNLLSKPADNRSVATTPNDYNGKLFFTGMKRRDALGAPGTVDYVNGFGWRGWGDSSGGKAWEVFGDNADLYIRCGSTTTWEAWRKILTDGNYASTLDGRYIRPTGTASQFLMADGSLTTKVTASAVANTGWQSNAVDDLKVPTMSFLAYWNGAHTNSGSSNLRYCDRGRFGTMAVANAADYLARSGGSMTNTNLVTNLNANYLGGYTHEQIRKNALGFTPTVVPTSSGNCDLDLLKEGMARNYWAPEKWVHAPEGFGYGAAVVFAPFGYTNLHGQLAWDVNHYTADVTGKLFWRAFATASDGTNKWGGWRQIAFTDSNVASATKLQTAHTLWGQSFDGTGSVSGELKHVTAIRFDSGNALVEGYGSAWNLWSVNGFQFYPVATSTVSALSINANGRVGVNMFSPAYDFDVTGVIHASGEIFSDKALGGKGTPSSSDIRLKHIVGNVELSFEAILNSPSKRFTWLGDPTKTERIGTTAQYWLPILPQVVYTAPDGYYAVDYGALANAKADTIAHVVAKLVERLNKLESQLNNRA